MSKQSKAIQVMEPGKVEIVELEIPVPAESVYVGSTGAEVRFAMSTATSMWYSPSARVKVLVTAMGCAPPASAKTHVAKRICLASRSTSTR